MITPMVEPTVFRRELFLLYSRWGSESPSVYLRRVTGMGDLLAKLQICISSITGTCEPAEYEWLYTEPEMLGPNGEELWIPLCESCCGDWRKWALEKPKPYRVRTLRVGAT